MNAGRGQLVAVRSCWTEQYALRHSVGYHVLGPGGPVGYVEEVLVDDAGDARVLLVRGARRLLVPVREIERIDADTELVRLRPAPL